jgi:hypothetical protein
VRVCSWNRPKHCYCCLELGHRCLSDAPGLLGLLGSQRLTWASVLPGYWRQWDHLDCWSHKGHQALPVHVELHGYGCGHDPHCATCSLPLNSLSLTTVPPTGSTATRDSLDDVPASVTSALLISPYVSYWLMPRSLVWFCSPLVPCVPGASDLALIPGSHSLLLLVQPPRLQTAIKKFPFRTLHTSHNFSIIS